MLSFTTLFVAISLLSNPIASAQQNPPPGEAYAQVGFNTSHYGNGTSFSVRRDGEQNPPSDWTASRATVQNFTIGELWDYRARASSVWLNGSFGVPVESIVCTILANTTDGNTTSEEDQFLVERTFSYGNPAVIAPSNETRVFGNLLCKSNATVTTVPTQTSGTVTPPTSTPTAGVAALGVPAWGGTAALVGAVVAMFAL